MSATTKALADLIYDRLMGLPETQDFDTNDLYTVAHEAAETITAAATTKVIIRAWLEENAIRPHTTEWLAGLAAGEGFTSIGRTMQHWAKAIREVSS